MKTYVCTAGTSVVTGTGLDLRHFAKCKYSDWEQLDEEIEVAKQFAMDAIRKTTKQAFPRISAELNSLIKMGLSGDDRVVLISTETIEGKLCAELVARVLRDRKLCSSVEVKVIDGLQAQDGRRFQQIGLKNLITYLAQFEHGEVVFNPTGGFKSVVPYITLAGMLFNKPVKYIHEFSDDVMTLTNIPLVFDEDLIFSIEDKLRKIDKESCISKRAWQKGIEFGESRFDCLVEEIDGKITMSSIGHLMWEKFKMDFSAEVTDEVRQLEAQRKATDFYKICINQFPDLELSETALTALHERVIDPRVIRSLHSVDHHQATPGMRWHKFEGGNNLWYCRFSDKGRIYVQMRSGLKPMVTAIDYNKKLQ